MERRASTRFEKYWTESGRGDGQGDVEKKDHQLYRRPYMMGKARGKEDSRDRTATRQHCKKTPNFLFMRRQSNKPSPRTMLFLQCGRSTNILCSAWNANLRHITSTTSSQRDESQASCLIGSIIHSHFTGTDINDCTLDMTRFNH